MKGSKRLVVLLPEEASEEIRPEQLDAIAEFSTLVRGNGTLIC